MNLRLTFRDKQKGKAWQRLIREQKEKEYAKLDYWKKIDTNLKKARIKEVDRKVAEKIIYEYEWLGTLPPCNKFFGIYFDEYCGGVACYNVGSIGAGGHVLAKMLGVKQRNVAYLARGACTFWTPTGTASKLISYTLKQFPDEVKMAIAFADTEAGEFGTVYQATNWLCLGRGSSITELISPNGVIRNMKNIKDWADRNNTTWGKMRRYLLEHGWKEQQSNPKYRYVYIMAKGAEKDKILKRLKPLISEYPKRK